MGKKNRRGERDETGTSGRKKAQLFEQKNQGLGKKAKRKALEEAKTEGGSAASKLKQIERHKKKLLKDAKEKFDMLAKEKEGKGRPVSGLSFEAFFLFLLGGFSIAKNGFVALHVQAVV